MATGAAAADRIPPSVREFVRTHEKFIEKSSLSFNRSAHALAPLMCAA